MATPRTCLRVAIVQFSPKLGQVDANIAKARELCSQLRPCSVDLVCLPEMIFSGYVFSTSAHISPYLEQPRTGPTSQFCAELAGRLQCFVAAGYPERLQPQEIEQAITSNGEQVEKIGANSAVVYGPSGEYIRNFRKTNLFETDMTWAKAGTGFASLTLPSPLDKVTLGICMDLNVQPPATWVLEEGPYELANHCLANKSNLLILFNAWLDSGEDVDEELADWRTVSYWAGRLRPLWVRNEEGNESGDSDEGSSDGEEGSTVVLVCNRTGVENGRTFAGSSALFNLTHGYGRPHLVHVMGRREEGVRVWNI